MLQAVGGEAGSAPVALAWAVRTLTVPMAGNRVPRKVCKQVLKGEAWFPKAFWMVGCLYSGQREKPRWVNWVK